MLRLRFGGHGRLLPAAEARWVSGSAGGWLRATDMRLSKGFAAMSAVGKKRVGAGHQKPIVGVYARRLDTSRFPGFDID